MARGLGTNVWHFRKLIITWKFGCQCHQQSEEVRVDEDEPGHRSCSEQIIHWTLVQKEQETEDSIGLPVVNGFLMVELGNSKDTTKTDCSDLWMEDSLVHTHSVVQCWRNCVQKTWRFLFGIRRWLHASKSQQDWPWNEGCISRDWWFGAEEKQLIPVYIKNNIFNFYLGKEVKSTKTNIANNSQQSGNEYGRPMRSYVEHRSGPRPREDVEVGNDEDPRVERNKNMKIQDMLFTAIGVLLVSKVEEWVDNIELFCWKKRKEKRLLRL